MIDKSKYSMNKSFQKLAYSRNPSDVFTDLLLITLSQFAPKPYLEEEHKDTISKYKEKEKTFINEWVYALIFKYEEGIKQNNWCDPLGDFYMELASSYKTKGLAQFFTPPAVCDLMTHMKGFTFKTDQKINDPACGSGRTLLSFHAHNYGNYCYAEDLDPVCVKMCATNFAFHGCLGEVVCHNSLSEPDTIRFGYQIKNIGLPIPAIIPITTEESYICKSRKLSSNPQQIKLKVPDYNEQLIYLM